jgi:hypothetical protein
MPVTFIFHKILNKKLFSLTFTIDKRKLVKCSELFKCRLINLKSIWILIKNAFFSNIIQLSKCTFTFFVFDIFDQWLIIPALEADNSLSSTNHLIYLSRFFCLILSIWKLNYFFMKSISFCCYTFKKISLCDETILQ